VVYTLWASKPGIARPPLQYLAVFYPLRLYSQLTCYIHTKVTSRCTYNDISVIIVLGIVRGSEQHCSVAHYHSHSYPLGKTHVEGLRILSGNVSFNECLVLCCSGGPSQCSYLWLFGTRCVALPCITNKTACSPRTLMSLPSVLVEIKYGKDQVTPGV